MNESLVSRLEEKLGADVFADLDLWVKGIVSAEAATKDQYRELSFRLEGLKDEVHWFREELTNFRAEVNQRLDTMNERIVSSIKWTVGTIALFGTIMTILMAISKFV